MYTYEIKKKLAKKLKKIAEKDPARYTEVSNKILLVAENPLIGKPLRNILKGDTVSFSSYFSDTG